MTGPVNRDAERARCILIVEDDYLIATDLHKVLRRSGFLTLGPASSVHQALGLLSEQRPDAAVLDFKLGEENVAPVADHLKNLGIPYILTSGSEAAELAPYPALAKVANLDKPTDEKRLVQTLQALFD